MLLIVDGEPLHLDDSKKRYSKILMKADDQMIVALRKVDVVKVIKFLEMYEPTTFPTKFPRPMFVPFEEVVGPQWDTFMRLSLYDTLQLKNAAIKLGIVPLETLCERKITKICMNMPDEVFSWMSGETDPLHVPPIALMVL